MEFQLIQEVARRANLLHGTEYTSVNIYEDGSWEVGNELSSSPIFKEGRSFDDLVAYLQELRTEEKSEKSS